jgi:hypothetical protein
LIVPKPPTASKREGVEYDPLAESERGSGYFLAPLAGGNFFL